MIRLSIHAQEALEERNLASSWIERTIAAPDFQRADPNDPSLTRSFKAIAEATVHFDRDAKP
ncbi:MAG: hypothetical protein WAV02_03320 [Stellaceae bacterium]